MKVAIYCRLSEEDRNKQSVTDDSNSIQNQNALKILRLQAEGCSTEQIAKSLKISPSTVKYHSRETCRKLGVNGKTAAVNEARNRKMI